MEALNMLVRGDSENAIRLLRDVVKQDTNHLDAYLQLGDILLQEGTSQNVIKIHQSPLLFLTNSPSNRVPS